MPSLASAIEFRLSATELTDDNFVDFLSKFVSKYGKQFIVKSLFTTFANQCVVTDDPANGQLHQSVLSEANSIISNILESQSSTLEPSTITSATEHTLNTLPSALIGKIASYVPQKDYINFSLLNRSMYMGCNTPNQLQELDMLQTTHYLQINLYKFQSLKHLTANLNELNHYQCIHSNKLQKPILNHLESLTLHIRFMTDASYDINSFIQQNIINTNSIKQLHTVHDSNAMFAINFASAEYTLNEYQMVKLLSKFPNLELFESPGISFDHNINIEQRILTLCPNLNAWIKNSQNGNIRILKTFDVPTCVSFNDLVDAKSATIGIEMENTNLDSICDRVKSALFESRNKPRDFMEIVFKINCVRSIECEELVRNISEIMLTMRISDISIFELSFSLRGDGRFDANGLQDLTMKLKGFNVCACFSSSDNSQYIRLTQLK